LTEQHRKQILSELSGCVRREVRPLREVRHPYGDARRQFGKHVALGVAEVFGKQFSAEMFAVL
jgi:hypothetical protein